MNREIWIGVILTALIVGGLVYLRYGKFWQDEPPQPEPVAQPEPAPAAAKPPEPERHPVPEASPAEGLPPLPALEDSDPAFRSALESVFGMKAVEAFLMHDRVIQKLVATVDSLDRTPVPLRIRPVAPVAGTLVVDAAGDAFTLNPNNSERYRPMISVLEATDAKAIARLYLRHYPLFQQAYRELGYPDGHFNDRLVAIIDHLLAAPEVKGPIRLVRHKGYLNYADPALEERSSGHKALIRIGPENAAVVKAKLRAIRAEITADAEGYSPPPE